MKKTFLFLTALAMSVVSMAASATYTKVTSDPTDWSGDYILVYESSETAARVFTGVDAASDFVEATISDNTITGEFVTLTLETTDGGYFVKVNGGDNDGKYFSSTSNVNDLKFADAGAVMSLSYDATNKTTMMVTPAGCVMRYNKSSGQDRFRFYKSSSYTSQQPVQLYKAGGTPTPQKEVVDVRVTDEPTKMEYFVGESFDPAGLTVTAMYDDASTEDVTSKATWTIEPATFTEASESASVSVKAEFNKVKSKPRTITGIVVTAKVVPTGYASVYTSNVELTAGDNSSDAVIKYDGGEYNGVKCGTSSKAGSCTTTIPAATKTLHFHAIGWKGAAATTLTVNGTEYTITPDDGITGNPPFTLVGDAYEYYYTFDPQGATEITFTSDKRFVVFGVNAELQEGVVAAPTFTPAATDFDQEVEVTLASETEGADIYYAINEEVTSMNAIKYTEPIELIETTTIYAIAKKDGKESAQAYKTYTLVPAYTVEEIAAITPAGQTFVLVLNEDEIVDTYTKDGKDGLSGIYFKATARNIELYQQNYALPKWEVGGTVSGRVMGEWTDFNGTWELKIAAEEVSKLSYTAPIHTSLINAKANAKATKAIVNGQFVIIRDNVRYNAVGQQL